MPTYTVGLDLGQAQDHSAVAVLEQEAAGGRPVYRCRHLERYPLGTPYVTGRDAPPEARGVGERLRALLSLPPLPGCTVVADETGVGRAVLDALRVLRLPCWLRPLTITAGAACSADPDGSFRVPKRELVGTLQALLGQGRLLVAASLPLARVLTEEMATFRVKVTAAANETFGSWRDGEHDDLVLAVGMAAWVAERCPPFVPGSIGTSNKYGGRGGERRPPSPFAGGPRFGGDLGRRY